MRSTVAAEGRTFCVGVVDDVFVHAVLYFLLSDRVAVEAKLDDCCAAAAGAFFQIDDATVVGHHLLSAREPGADVPTTAVLGREEGFECHRPI